MMILIPSLIRKGFVSGSISAYSSKMLKSKVILKSPSIQKTDILNDLLKF
jgi:hypothetical protein